MREGDITREGTAVLTPAPYVDTLTRDMALGTGSVGYTGIGFKPSAIVFNSCVNFDSRASWTLSSENNGGANAGGVVMNSAATVSDWAMTNGSAVYMDNGPDYYFGTISSYDADGFTISWNIGSGSPAGVINVRFLAFR